MASGIPHVIRLFIAASSGHARTLWVNFLLKLLIKPVLPHSWTPPCEGEAPACIHCRREQERAAVSLKTSTP